MEFDLKTIGLWVAIWLVGYFLGLLEASIKNKRKEKHKKIESPAPAINTVVDEKLLHPSLGVLDPEILAVYERVSGALKLRIDGEMVEYESDLNTEKRTRLLDVVIAMRPWLERADKKQKTIDSSLRTDVKIETTPMPTTPVVNAGIDLGARVEETASSKLSMVEQIDQVLQKKLKGSPLEKRGIQLRTSISGALLIQVGLDTYEWIDKIPDQAVQNIIREAIANWEKNTTSGA